MEGPHDALLGLYQVLKLLHNVKVINFNSKKIYKAPTLCLATGDTMVNKADTGFAFLEHTLNV